MVGLLLDSRGAARPSQKEKSNMIIKNTLKIRRFNVYKTIAAMLVANSHPILIFIDRGEIDTVMVVMSVFISIFFLLSWYRLISLSISNSELVFNQGMFSKGHRFKVDSIQELFVNAVNNEPYQLEIKTDSNDTHRIKLNEPKSDILVALMRLLKNKVVFHPSIKNQFL